MKKSSKIWISIAIISIIIGSVIFVTTMSILRWDFDKLSTSKFTTNVYEISEDFSGVSIDVITADVVIEPSSDNKCKVTCFEDEKVKHLVTIQNGALCISEDDSRTFFDKFGVNFTSPKITVSLPTAQYNQIVIETTTANVCVKNVLVSSLKIDTTTGDVCVKNSTFTDNLTIKVTTGDVDLNYVNGGKIDVKTTTGDVELNDVDGSEIYLKTTTGDVEGNILTDKKFVANSTTGDIDVPKDTVGEICQVETTTGDIDLQIKRA